MKTLHLYIFIDALGWELVERHKFCTDFLPCRFPVTTQLGYSAGAVPTILCGKTPPEHGHFSFFYYDPKHSPFRWMRFFPSFLFPDAIFGRHRVRHHLSKFIKKILGYTGYFQLYRVPFRRLPMLNYSEKRDMFVPGGLEAVPNLADAWQGKKYHISNWRNSGKFNFEEMEKLIEHSAIEYGFLYNADLDGFLHRNISNPAAVQAELLRYEKMIRQLYQKAASHYDQLEFAVFSDHGMTPLNGTYDLRPYLKNWTWGKEYVSFLDSTMARFWWLCPEKRDEIRLCVETLHKGHWLTPEEKIRYHVNFSDNRYGDDVYLLDAGGQFAPSDMGGKALPGMHGFTPDDKDSDACFLSNRPPVLRPVWIGDFFKIMTAENKIQS